MDLETGDPHAAGRTRRTRREPVDRATLDELFELARWAPNHHLTNPWRFRVLGPDALARLKAAADGLEPGSGAKLDRAPTLVAVSVTQAGDPVADEEDALAGAVAAYIVLLARARPRARPATGARPPCCARPRAARRSASATTSACSACCTSAARARSSARPSARRSRRS